MGFPYVCIRTAMENYTDRIVPWHWHTSCEIVNVEEGTVEFKTPDIELTLNKGDAVFVNTGVLHTYIALSEQPAIMYTHLFRAEFLSGAYNSVFDKKFIQPVCRCKALQAWHIRPDSREHMAMVSAMFDAAALMDSEPYGYEFDLRTKLCDFWKGLFAETEKIRADAPVRNSADQERIKLMMDYIQNHYPEPLTVENIGSTAGISARECNRCFRRCIGMSPIEYLTGHRVRAAAEMLSGTSKTILEIGEECGFSSPSYFSKVFRLATGDTPNAYRKKAQ